MDGIIHSDTPIDSHRQDGRTLRLPQAQSHPRLVNHLTRPLQNTQLHDDDDDDDAHNRPSSCSRRIVLSLPPQTRRANGCRATRAKPRDRNGHDKVSRLLTWLHPLHRVLLAARVDCAALGWGRQPMGASKALCALPNGNTGTSTGGRHPQSSAAAGHHRRRSK